MRAATIGDIRVRCETGGDTFGLAPGSELGAGGQATVYPVPGRPGRVAKVYHAPAPEQERKLRLMLAHRPAGASSGAGAGIFAWPLELLRDEEGGFAGLLLPRVEGKLRLFELYNPATRRERAPLFHHGLLHRAARNLAAAFHKLHEAGYVVGDVNESNVLVGEDGRVVLIDTDSFQVRDPATNEVFRCPVGRPEFTPPELSGRSFGEIDRAPEHDRFGLGVLVFQMLMEGTHPFAGRFRGEGEPPAVQERIAAGHFPYSGRADVPLEPPRTAPPLDTLDPALRALLLRCFVDGHRDPAARPTAAEWRDALLAAEASLATCGSNEQHRYGPHLGACPWCERSRRLEGRDPFPSAGAVERGEHRPRPVPARPPRTREPAPARRPRFRGLAQVRGWKPLAPLPAALFGAALLVALLGAIAPAFPLLTLAVVTGALLFGANRTARGGSLAPWATALALVLVMVGFAGAWRTARPWPEPEHPVRYEYTRSSEPLTPVPFAFDVDAVQRKPVPENLDSIAGALADLRVAAPGHSQEPGVELVVDEDGRVDPATLAVVPADDAALLEAVRPALLALRFQPAVRLGRPVRNQVSFVLRRAGDRVEPAFDRASWVAPVKTFTERTLSDSRPSIPPAYEAPAEEPVLLNRDEVEALLQRTFPPVRRREGTEGLVTVRFLVDRSGVVAPGSIVIVDTIDDDAFAAPAAIVAARMRYQPAMHDGEPVPAYVTEQLGWSLYS
jgi:hypothetical protein